MNRPTAKGLAQSNWFAIAARIMTILTPFILVGGASWLSQRDTIFDQKIDAALEARQTIAAKVEENRQSMVSASVALATLQQQTAVLESKSGADRMTIEKMNTKLDKINDSILSLSSSMAAVAASVNSIQRQADRPGAVNPK